MPHSMASRFAETPSSRVRPHVAFIICSVAIWQPEEPSFQLIRSAPPHAQVVVIPMKHVASQPFYDSVIEELHNADITAVLVEGVMDDQAQYDLEMRQLKQLEEVFRE